MEITFLGGSLCEFIERQGLQLLRHLPPAEEVMGGQPPSPHLGRDAKAGREEEERRKKDEERKKEGRLLMYLFAICHFCRVMKCIITHSHT